MVILTGWRLQCGGFFYFQNECWRQFYSLLVVLSSSPIVVFSDYSLQWQIIREFFVKGTVAWTFLSTVISPKVPNWSSDLWSIDSNSPRNLTSKIFFFCTMGRYGELRYALWATASNLVVHYGPLRQIWLYAMGNCGGFGSALWATARN